MSRSVSTPSESVPYGLIGHIRVQPGRRPELAAILTEGSSGMPGCLSYVVAEDLTDPDALWVTEVWSDQAAHRASLDLPAVQEAIGRGRPLIVEFDAFHETRPIGVSS
jgi:quinol monooxygenase YgiN